MGSCDGATIPYSAEDQARRLIAAELHSPLGVNDVLQEAEDRNLRCVPQPNRAEGAPVRREEPRHEGGASHSRRVSEAQRRASHSAIVATARLDAISGNEGREQWQGCLNPASVTSGDAASARSVPDGRSPGQSD
jgi:hypothetical protein